MKIITAFDYLKDERKLSDETIKKFHLAWCDSQGEIYIDANFNGKFPLLNVNFNNSTIFPIFDLYNEVVGVSCRPLIQKVGSSKYYNTPYEKSEHLYGLSVTAANCLQTQTAYVVEGNISLLQMYQAGVTNCVAMLGSKLSVRQICLLNRFVKKIVLVPDADKAGRKLLEKMQKEVIPAKLYDSDVKFTYIELPDGKDPDDFFKINSIQDFLSLPEKEL